MRKDSIENKNQDRFFDKIEKKLAKASEILGRNTLRLI